MRSKSLTVSAFVLAVLFLMAMAAPSWGASIPCTGQLGAVEIKGNVHAGPGCDLLGTAVSGNVIVEPGGELETNFACRSGRIPRCQDEPTATLITGNVQSSEAAEIRLAGATFVKGNLQLTGTDTGAGTTSRFVPVRVSGGTVKGNVEIKGGVPEAGVEHEIVGGDFQILTNSSATPAFGHMNVEADTVGGNLEVGNNALVGFRENELAIAENSVAGNLRVDNNSTTFGEEGNFVLVRHNHVGGNAELVNNTQIPSPPPFTSGFIVFSVGFNTVTNNLICTGNEPPPVGKENTAKQRLGQCELL